MNLIVAVDRNWGIGREGKLLFDIPEDMKFFRETTAGKVVVMGRKTLESFPEGKPLKNRKNIVLSKKDNIPHYENLIQVKSFDELFKEVDLSDSKDVFVIGGAEIYNSLLPYCDTLYITKIESDGNADTFIDNVDIRGDYFIDYESDYKEYNGLKFRFLTYRKRAV